MANINEQNHFTQSEPEVNVKRSVFNEDQENVLTCKSGDIVPIYTKEVLPGDTFQIGLAFVGRMLTPVVPVLDNAFLDVFAFYVPNRVLCSKYHLTENADTGEEDGDWETFLGENKSSAWAPDHETVLKSYNACGFLAPDHGVAPTSDCLFLYPQSIADYLGFPLYDDGNTVFTDEHGYSFNTGSNGLGMVNGLKFACYDYIWNLKFRNQNFDAMSLLLQSGEIDYYKEGYLPFTMCLPTFSYTSYNATVTGDATYHLVADTDIYIANKYNDYFTSSLPEPYKYSSEISLALGDSAPVTVSGLVDVSGVRVNAKPPSIDSWDGETSLNLYGGQFTSDTGFVLSAGGSSSDAGVLYTSSQSASGSMTGIADLSQATAITINQLRNEITIQHLAENFARCGTLYPEILMGNYGVRPSDAAIQYPELLGAHRFPINTTQVSSQSASGDQPLGTIGAYSKTVGSDEYLVSKSFTEHGYIMIMAVIRTSQKYWQGYDKSDLRSRRFDYYWPEFAHLGEQPVDAGEIYAGALGGTFGYQEAWADYKYGKDQLHGYIRPEAGDETLSQWTYQLAYKSRPYLGSDFEKQSFKNIANVLYDSTTSSQFVFDYYFNVKAIRPMPVFSIPGIDRI